MSWRGQDRAGQDREAGRHLVKAKERRKTGSQKASRHPGIPGRRQFHFVAVALKQKDSGRTTAGREISNSECVETTGRNKDQEDQEEEGHI